MTDNLTIRHQVIALLDGSQAHATFDRAVADLPAEYRGQAVDGVDHTPWRLVEHMRLAQQDILEYIRDPNWQSPAWPDGYWPTSDAPPDAQAWEQSLTAFQNDLQALCDLVGDPNNKLLHPPPHVDDPSHTILRQAILAAEHNAYHIGQLVFLRRALNVWA